MGQDLHIGHYGDSVTNVAWKLAVRAAAHLRQKVRE